MENKMNNLFSEYKKVNPNITEDMFNQTYEMYGEEYIQIINDELKKKDPQDTSLNTENGIPPQENPNMPLPITSDLEGESQYPYQDFSELGGMEIPTSTALDLGNGLYSSENELDNNPDIDVPIPTLSDEGVGISALPQMELKSIKEYNAELNSLKSNIDSLAKEYETTEDTFTKNEIALKYDQLVNQYDSIRESDGYKQSIEQENQRIKTHNDRLIAEQKAQRVAYAKQVSQNIEEAKTINNTIKQVVKGDIDIKDVEDDRVKSYFKSPNGIIKLVDKDNTIVNLNTKNFLYLGKDKDQNDIYRTNDGVDLVYKDNTLKIGEYEFGKDFTISKGIVQFNNEEEEKPKGKPSRVIPAKFNTWIERTFTDDINKQNNIHFKNEKAGVLEIMRDENGEVVYNEDGSARWRFINKEYYDEDYMPYINRLNEERGYYEEGSIADTYQKRNDRRDFNERLQAGANREKELKEHAIKELGEEIAKKYDYAPTKAEIRYEKILARTRQIAQQRGITEREAQKMAETEYAQNEKNKVDASAKLVADIVNIADDTAKRFGGKRGGNNTQYLHFEDSERKVWNKIAKDPEFAEWFNEYGKRLFSDSKGNVSREVASDMRNRERMLQQFNIWKQEKEYDYSQALKSTRERDLKAKMRWAREEGNGRSVAELRRKFTPVQNAQAQMGQKMQSLQMEAGEISNAFGILRKEELETAKEYAKYQNGELGAVASVFTKNVVNALSNVASDFVGGIEALATPFSQSATTHLYHASQNRKNPFNVLNQGEVSDEIEKYSLNGKVVEKRRGYIFDVDKDGKLTLNEELSNNPSVLKNWKFEGKDYDVNLAGTVGMIAETTAYMYGVSATARGLASMTGRVMNLSKMSRVASLNASRMQKLGFNPTMVKHLNNFAPKMQSVYSQIGWGMTTLQDNIVEGLEQGLDNRQAFLYGSFQSIATGLLSTISPDEKFFGEYKAINSEILRLISKNKFDGAKKVFNEHIKKLARDNFGEMLQEETERQVQNAINGAYNTVMGTEFSTGDLDEFIHTMRDTGISTTALRVANVFLRGSGVKLNGQTKLEQTIVASQIPDFESNFVDTLADERNREDALRFKAILGKVRNYVSQIPEGSNLKLEETAKVVQSMENIEKLKAQKKKNEGNGLDEVYNEKIKNEEAKISDVFNQARLRNNQKPNTQGNEDITSETETEPQVEENIVETPTNVEVPQGREANIETEGISINTNEDTPTHEETPLEQGSFQMEYGGKIYTIIKGGMEDENGHLVPFEVQNTILTNGKVLNKGEGKTQGDNLENNSNNGNFANNNQENEIHQQVSGGTIQEGNGEKGEIQRSLSILRGSSDTNFEKQQGLSNAERKQIEDREKQTIYNHAKDNGLWVDNIYQLGNPMKGGGMENTLVLGKDNTTIYKSNNLLNSENSIETLLETIEAHNLLFPNTAYEIAGYTGFVKPNNQSPYVEVILKQEFIPDTQQATPQEIADYMQSLGFEKVNDTTFSNGEYVVSDLHPRNVLKDENGTIYVVDNIIRKATEKTQSEIKSDTNENNNDDDINLWANARTQGNNTISDGETKPVAEELSDKERGQDNSQGIQESPKSGRSEEEVEITPKSNPQDLPTHDQNGKAFVRNSKGELSFGEISQEIADQIKRQSAPIMLSEGDSKYGEKHIESRRGKEIRDFGYSSARNMVEDVVQNYNEIYKESGGKLVLVKRNGKDKIAVVKLTPTEKGDVYSITTSAIVRKDYTNKKELLWKSEPSKEATTTSSNSHTISPSSVRNVSDADSSNSISKDRKKSVKKDTSKVKSGNATDVKKSKVSRLNTDESRFQGRKKLNETIVNHIAENFSEKDQDPIHIWKDPKDGKYYVLSGHHRYYGAKRAGVKQVKVIDRTEDFTEAEAIRFAKEEANANRSMETPMERASTLRQKRERGDDKAEIETFLKNEGRNKNLINNLSYLTPNGKAMQSMAQFETANESDSKRETEKIADWTGEVMRIFDGYLTPAHENEIYDYLSDKNKSKRFTNKREFVEKVRSLIGFDFNPNEPLNLARVSVKGSQEQEWENETKRLENEIADYEKQITDLDKRFTDPKRSDYISPETKNFQELKDRARKEKARLKAEQEAVYKKLDEHKRAKGNYLKADSSMGNLFGDIDFQIGASQEVQNANQKFNAELEAFEKGEHKGDIILGRPSAIMQSVGLSGDEIFITSKTLRSHLDKHNLSINDIKNLPQALQNPLMIYEWGTKAKSLIAITDLNVGNKKITVAVKLERNGKAVEINELASIHGKENTRFISDVVNAKNGGLTEALKYVADKQKVLEWLGLVPPKGTASLSNQELSIANIINNFENPNVVNEYSSYTDRELKDLERGISDEINRDIAGTKGLLERANARLNHPLYAKYFEIGEVLKERKKAEKERREKLNEEYEKKKALYKPTKEPLKLSNYDGSRVVYHGTKLEVAEKIAKEGIKFGNELSDTDWRGGGYDVKDQNSFSTSLDPNVSKYYSGENKVGIVKLELNPNANIITIENEIYAEDLQNYTKELKGVDAVYLKNSGEEEIVILNKSAVKVVEAKSFKASDKIIEYQKKKNNNRQTPYKKGKISNSVFEKLVKRLKKAFKGAFKGGVHITHDWNDFMARAEAYHSREYNKRVNDEFNRRLEEIEQGKLGKPLSLGFPNAILRSVGIGYKNILIEPNTIIAKTDKHGYKPSDIKGLAEAINNPIAIFKGSQEGSFAVLTEVEVNGNKVLVSISVGKGNYANFNMVSSVYGKSKDKVADWINRDKATYINKEKALKYLRGSTPIVDSKRNSTLIGTKLQKEIETAKEKIENFVNPRVDIEVDYQLDVWHGSPHSFDKFSTEHIGSGEGGQMFGWGLYFTEEKEIAEWYADTLVRQREVLSVFENNWKSTTYELNFGSLSAKQVFADISTALHRIKTQKEFDNYIQELEQRYKNRIQEGKDWIKNPNSTSADRKLEKQYIKDYEERLENLDWVKDTFYQGEHSHRNLYSVSIHKGKNADQYSFIEWYESLNNRQVEAVKEVFDNILNRENDYHKASELARYFDRYDFENKTGQEVYKELSKYLGSDKAVSLALLEAGIDGIKYPTESIARGSSYDGNRKSNFVVFDDGAVEVKEHIEYMRTSNGKPYGAKLPDGTMYINPEHFNANTPIHEFGHLWAQIMPKRFAEGVRLLQQTKAGRELYNKLKQDPIYGKKPEHKIWEEALVSILGDRGEELFHSSSTSKFVDWVKDFFKAIGNYLHKVSNGLVGKELTPNDKLQTFVKGALSEIMSGKQIIPESNVAQSEVPIYLKDMSNNEMRELLENLDLVIPSKCA